MICEVIKWNESNVGNVNFEVDAKRSCKFLCFTLFKNFKELFVSLQPDVNWEGGLGSKYSILNKHVVYSEKSELNFADMRLIPLDRVTYAVDDSAVLNRAELATKYSENIK